MSITVRRYIFYTIWFFIILSGPITVFRNTSAESFFSSSIVMTNTFQRLTGLLAFSLIFIQIALGAHMNRFIQIIGAKAYRIHTLQGLVTYGFMFVHPLFQNIIVYQVSKSFTESLLVFVPSMGSQRDVLLVFGRMAFLLGTISVIAAFFRRKWRAFHILNYLVFYLVFYHARVGSDLASQPFDLVYWAAFIFVSGTIFYRFTFRLVKKFIPVRAVHEKLH